MGRDLKSQRKVARQGHSGPLGLQRLLRREKQEAKSKKRKTLSSLVHLLSIGSSAIFPTNPHFPSNPFGWFGFSVPEDPLYSIFSKKIGFVKHIISLAEATRNVPKNYR
jgi:hypothetical protein